MSDDKKAPGGKPRDETQRRIQDLGDAGAARPTEAVRKAETVKPVQDPFRVRAPDADVLPGILGKQLRAAYGELLNAPIPDAIAQLVKKLGAEEGPVAHQAKSDKTSQEENGQ